MKIYIAGCSGGGEREKNIIDRDPPRLFSYWYEKVPIDFKSWLIRMGNDCEDISRSMDKGGGTSKNCSREEYTDPI